MGNYYPSIWKDPYRTKWLVLELLVCSIFMPPKINEIYNGQMVAGYFSYSLDMIITTVILLKSYLLIRVYPYLSMWTDS